MSIWRRPSVSKWGSMRKTGIDRRQFIAAMGVVVLTTPRPGYAARPEHPVFLTCSKHAETYQATLFDSRAKIQWRIDLPDRGHGGAFHPRSTDCVTMARRPGSFAVVADRTNGQVSHMLAPPAGRHFYGHCCFSADGRVLFTTENDYEGERGVIGLWDASDGYKRLGEFDSFGIGPHEVITMPDGHTLAIGNGGILTHPDTGRRKLNIPDMEPSLVLIDGRDGKLISKTVLPREHHKLSIRHLTVNRAGILMAAMQFEGSPDEHPPLVLKVEQGKPAIFSTPDRIQTRLKNYGGAVAFDASGSFAAVSFPRGNIVTFWSVDGTFRDAVRLDEGCGVARGVGPGDFILSSGAGAWATYQAATGGLLAGKPLQDTRWDNHIAVGMAAAD